MTLTFASSADLTINPAFDGASMAKVNFHSATLQQTNFFNADCNNANFDSGAMDKVSSRPAKAWGIRYDMDREEFEKQVGLRAMTSRATKRFKGLEMLLKAQAQAQTPSMLTSLLDRDGDGDVMDDVAGMATSVLGGMFGGKK